MKIYLDSCALNRPYDALEQVTVSLEAQAKLSIQEWIRDKKYELVSSEMLLAEIYDTPSEVRKQGILAFIEENSSIHVGKTNNYTVKEMATEFTRANVGYKDACHAASAIIAGCEYLITTDYRFIRRFRKLNRDDLKITDPIEFVKEMEEEKN